MDAAKNLGHQVEERFLHLNHPGDAHGALPEEIDNPGTSPLNQREEYVHDFADEKDHEKRRLPRRHSTTSRYSTQSNGYGVDVERAEAHFHELNRQISHLSRASQKLSRVNSTRSKTITINTKDVEKATSSDESEDEPFDLEQTLRQSKRMEEESGIRDKRIGVLWEDLTVRGSGGSSKLAVRTFIPSPFVEFFDIYTPTKNLLGFGKKGTEMDILKGFRGVVKPGEMVLVLGRPGSGCTSFLKVISNQRFGYTSIDGEVKYGPFDSDTFAKKYRGEAVYNMEDDVHHPSISVAQTLEFALDVKTPAKRIEGVSQGEFKSRVVDVLLKMFNIEHTRSTVIGNQFIRGVSGGERKRVSIAEMMICGAAVCAWDNSTRGLDSSTALDYVKSLRIITNIYHSTTFVSLYQASEGMYAQFDKVLVIEDGRQLFFGSAIAARSYFEGLGYMEKPRLTTPDYLCACVDANEREFQPGRSEQDVPSTPEALELAFKESTHAARLDKEIDSYKEWLKLDQKTFDEFQQAIKDGKRRTKSVYTVSFPTQIWALIKRQFFLKLQDWFSLTVSYITSIVIACVVGTVWINQPRTSAGAFTRGGVLFISLLFNCFQAFAELPKTMLGRPLINKHRAYCFHTPSALWVAQILVDLFFAAIQITVFSIIVYFSSGLYRTPGAFFSFLLFIISAYCAMTLFFRTIGCMSSSFDVAIKAVCVMLAFLVVSSGYLIALPSQSAWYKWLFYINPIGLAFSSLMINEFRDLDLTCTKGSLIPSGPTYSDITHQVCTLRGSTAGSYVISGAAYISDTFAYFVKDEWFHFALIWIMIIALLTANILLGEYVLFGAGGKTVTFYAKETAETKKLNEVLLEKRERRRRKEKATGGAELNIASKSVLTWENLCYKVPVAGGEKQLLNNVFGYVKPGQLTALMGASGAGKTTLLDVLAARKNIGTITGDMLVDGAKPGTAFQRGTAYAEQLDLHESTNSVRGALRFSADLRQPYHIPQAEKYAWVEEVLSLMELEDIADAIIGSPEAGLSVAQRKLVTIGVELAAKPDLLLFLDEPTSGLDSQSAFNIVRFLKKLAAAGQAILCTIHQPNAALFESFDRLLLLQRGGETVYFGEIGKDAQVLLDYFARHGKVAEKTDNPAEFMLEAIGAGARPSNQDWHQLWKDSPEFATIKEDIVALKKERMGMAMNDGSDKEYATPLWHQIKVVNRRTQLAFWRSPDYGFTRLFNHFVFAFVPGLIFLNLSDSRTDLQYKVFVIFQVTVLPALILAAVEPKYDVARLVYYRENAAKAYGQLPFALSMVLAEMPYSLMATVVFFLPLYYMTGFSTESSRAGYTFLMILITELFAVTLGQAVAALTPSSFISALANPFLLIINGLLCGVTVPAPQIPKGWKWLYELVPFHRLVSGSVVTALHNLPVHCRDFEYNHFTSPPDTTCGAYMSAFFAAGGAGYLENNNTQDCAYCAYRIGNEFYENLGLSYGDRWRDAGIFLAFIGSNLVLLGFASRYLNYNRR